jgi:hypothetical protein
VGWLGGSSVWMHLEVCDRPCHCVVPFGAGDGVHP